MKYFRLTICIGLLIFPIVSLATDNIGFFWCGFTKSNKGWTLSEVINPEGTISLGNGERGHFALWTTSQSLNSGQCVSLEGTSTERLKAKLVIFQSLVIGGFSSSCDPIETSGNTIGKNENELLRGEFIDGFENIDGSQYFYHIYYPFESELTGDLSAKASSYCSTIHPVGAIVKTFTVNISK